MSANFRIIILLIPLILSSYSSMVPVNEEIAESNFSEDDWRSFTIDENRILEALGSEGQPFVPEGRPTLAISRLGIHGVNGTLLNTNLPDYALQPRSDLSLLIIDGDTEISSARNSLSNIEGIVIREFISPSGLVVQGTTMALMQASMLTEVRASMAVPLAMLVEDKLLEDWILAESGEIEITTAVRIEGWRDSISSEVPDNWELSDNYGNTLTGDVTNAANRWLENPKKYDAGRWEGVIAKPQLSELLSDPAVGWFRAVPTIGIDNDRSRNYMDVDDFQDPNPYFTSPLDGSGEIIAVADTGLDHDHGDFGNRVDAKVDMVGDGSTADTDSGHGTHVACTVLGDGSRGGYRGVASGANLYFQAMEHDASGNMYSASINYLINTAYNSGARTHTNSWGSQDTSSNGQYTSDSEDVDDRANYYDRYYNGRQGMSIIFAAGNDGPDPGSVGPPSTAKNSLTVGMHQARYSGAPDTIMSGSGRGPTDDGRIKPDVLAPGGYVRSCRAQEAQDTSGSTWNSQWYLEYTGTSMATPNAAGAAALVREYLTEIALRPEPQGALVKALLVLGAEDVGSRNIPNNNEGWGRINLENTLSPSGNRGIWVDDRSVLSNSGAVKTYSFEVDQSGYSFKTVLTWSDERGSRFSQKQLVNDLDLEVEAPDGTLYLGNVFASGKSQVGGTRDSVNNLEVVLIDVASVGTWTVRVKDTSHSGSTSQPFAIAISGNGVNDLRPDPTPIIGSISTNTPIPQVDEEVTLTCNVENLGNVAVEDVLIHFNVDGSTIDSKTIDLNPAQVITLYWTWIPSTAGNLTVSIEVDPLDAIEEIRENNNVISKQIGVTTPGVKLTSTQQTNLLQDSDQSLSSWRVEITNTALISTNASLSSNGVIRQSDNQEQSWYVGISNTSFSLNGTESAFADINLIHPTPPDPGNYVISIVGEDKDNSIFFPYELFLEVPSLAKARVSIPSLVTVSPVESTNFSFELFNEGNSEIGYNLFLDSPTGWQAGFTDLGAQPGAPSASSGAISRDGSINVGISITPPISMVRAGTELTLDLRIISQTENSKTLVEEINLRVGVVEDLEISLESTIGMLRADSKVNLQFSVFNQGNSDATLTPSIKLPGGWSVTSGMNTLTVDYGDGYNWLVGIEGNGYAVGGNMTLTLSSSTGEISWSTYISVLSIANPEVTFLEISYPDNSNFPEIDGGGPHLPGSQYNLTWEIVNTGSGVWSPTAALDLPPGYSGECEEPESVSSGEEVLVTCQVSIPEFEIPDSQPQIKLVLEGSGIELTNIVSLLIAEDSSVVWTDELLPELETGTQHLVKLRIENTGNSMLSNVVQVEAPDGWDIVIDSGTTVTLEAGQSAPIRLFVTSTGPGTEKCTIRLTNADDIEGSEHTFNLTAFGDEVIDETSGGLGGVILWSSLIIIIVGGILAIVLILRNDKSKKAYNQMLSYQYQQAYAAQYQQMQYGQNQIAANVPQTPHSAPTAESFVSNQNEQEQTGTIEDNNSDLGEQ